MPKSPPREDLLKIRQVGSPRVLPIVGMRDSVNVSLTRILPQNEEHTVGRCLVALYLSIAGLATASCPDSPVVFIDSGASSHMTPHSHVLVTSKPKSGLVSLGDINVKLDITAHGETRLPIGNFLLVPQLSYSLISVPTLDSLGFRCVFENQRFRVTHHARTLLTATLTSHGLYQLDTKYVKRLFEETNGSNNMSTAPNSGGRVDLPRLTNAPQQGLICEVPTSNLKRDSVAQPTVSRHYSQREARLAVSGSAHTRESDVCTSFSQPYVSATSL
jgi:hypothetical protein